MTFRTLVAAAAVALLAGVARAQDAVPCKALACVLTLDWGGSKTAGDYGPDKRYGSGEVPPAVAGIDLEIRDGEFFSLLGPSGSGKTTTLRMIAGFEAPTSGQIWLHGEEVTAKPPFDRDVNTVFQDYALFPHMSVQENVEYGLRVKRVAKGERASRRLAIALAEYQPTTDRRYTVQVETEAPLRRNTIRRRAVPAASTLWVRDKMFVQLYDFQEEKLAWGKNSQGAVWFAISR